MKIGNMYTNFIYYVSNDSFPKLPNYPQSNLPNDSKTRQNLAGQVLQNLIYHKIEIEQLPHSQI